MKFPYLVWNKGRESFDNIAEIWQEQKVYYSIQYFICFTKTSNITVPVKMLSMATESKYYFVI